MTEEYSNMTDEAVIALVHNENDLEAQDYIIDKYKPLVIAKARSYFIMGADKEDIIQEGMIGLYKAIRDFNPKKQAGFFSFAELCILRQIITAIKMANRQKHLPLNSYLSLNRSVYDEEDDCTYIELLSYDIKSDPESLVIGNENKKAIEKSIVLSLSKLERQVLNLYLKGKSYVEIAKIIKRDEKSIDNALQRIKKKVEKIVQNKK